MLRRTNRTTTPSVFGLRAEPVAGAVAGGRSERRKATLNWGVWGCLKLLGRKKTPACCFAWFVEKKQPLHQTRTHLCPASGNHQLTGPGKKSRTRPSPLTGWAPPRRIAPKGTPKNAAARDVWSPAARGCAGTQSKRRPKTVKTTTCPRPLGWPCQTASNKQRGPSARWASFKGSEPLL